jgi:hypothetical protein
MKFVYQYRTSDNVRHEGVLSAPSREVVFEILKRQGIRPSAVQLAPGLFNRLLGNGKRWLAIVILFVLMIAGWSFAFFETGTENLIEDRQQLYGDPAVLRQAYRSYWTNVFESVGDAYLAEHAVPASYCRCNGRQKDFSNIERDLNDRMKKMVPVRKGDYSEIAKMKRMVNGLKKELSQYVEDGGTIAGYMERLDIRQAAERAIVERAHAALKRSNSVELMQKKNNELRAMGLPMVIPDEL